MVTGIIGKKVGMTQLFLEDGTLGGAGAPWTGPIALDDLEEDAARKYDENAKSLGRPLNFPVDPSHLRAQKCAPRFPRSKVAKEADEEVQDQDQDPK